MSSEATVIADEAAKTPTKEENKTETGPREMTYLEAARRQLHQEEMATTEESTPQQASTPEGTRESILMTVIPWIPEYAESESEITEKYTTWFESTAWYKEWNESKGKRHHKEWEQLRYDPTKQQRTGLAIALSYRKHVQQGEQAQTLQLPTLEEDEESYRKRQTWLAAATDDQRKMFEELYWTTERKKERVLMHLSSAKRNTWKKKIYYISPWNKMGMSYLHGYSRTMAWIKWNEDRQSVADWIQMTENNLEETRIRDPIAYEHIIFGERVTDEAYLRARQILTKIIEGAPGPEINTETNLKEPTCNKEGGC